MSPTAAASTRPAPASFAIFAILGASTPAATTRIFRPTGSFLPSCNHWRLAMSLSGRHDKPQAPLLAPQAGAIALRRNSAVPFYEQLKQVLIAQIEQGDVEPGDPL